MPDTSAVLAAKGKQQTSKIVLDMVRNIKARVTDGSVAFSTCFLAGRQGTTATGGRFSCQDSWACALTAVNGIERERSKCGSHCQGRGLETARAKSALPLCRWVPIQEFSHILEKLYPLTGNLLLAFSISIPRELAPIPYFLVRSLSVTL